MVETVHLIRPGWVTEWIHLPYLTIWITFRCMFNMAKEEKYVKNAFQIFLKFQNVIFPILTLLGLFTVQAHS